jgi:DNA-binding transcriptional LysR family regulator
VTYDQLVTLKAVVEYGSFKAASEHLFKSQPSLSVAIKKLEEEFEIQIFNREEYRPKLTEAGKAFYQKTLQALNGFNELENLGKELGTGVEAEIKVSVDGLVSITHLQDVFREFFLNSIATNLNITSDVLGGAYEKLMSGDVDVAIGPLFVDDSSIEKFEFKKIRMIPVAAPTLLKEVKNMAELERKFPQVITKGTGSTNDISSGVLPHTKKWYVSDGTQKEDLIKSGLGWGRLPEFKISCLLKEGKLERIQIKGMDETEFPLFVMRNGKVPMGQKTKDLWEALKGCADE